MVFSTTPAIDVLSMVPKAAGNKWVWLRSRLVEISWNQPAPGPGIPAAGSEAGTGIWRSQVNIIESTGLY